MLTVGLIVNPIAGLGGAVALKGSDGVAELALSRGARPRAEERTLRALRSCGDAAAGIRWLTWSGAMGAGCLEAAALPYEELGRSAASPTAADTRAAVAAMVTAGVDLIVFAGGDGTARNVLEAMQALAESTGERGGPSAPPVLGIPAGVKMHSGVFATTPEMAGELLARLSRGGLVQSVAREVKDLDEEALRAGVLRPRSFGELSVPEPGGYLQHTKERGRENEALAVEEIAAEVLECLEEESRPVVLGPGSTVGRIKTLLGMQPTLLGFDVWQGGETLASDVDAAWLEEQFTGGPVVLSFTRGQGFLLGRGNQQLSPTVLRRLDRSDLMVLGTRTKLASLEGRPLLVDTDDAELDRSFVGLIEIIAGYQDRLFYRVDRHA